MNHELELTPEGWCVAKNDTHLSKWIREQKTLDVAAGFVDSFKQYIPEGGTVIDVGACLGDHTIAYLRLVGPKGWVIAFEPNPIAYEAMSYNLYEKLGAPNVVTICSALGHKEMTVGLNRCHNLGMTTICEGEDARMGRLDDWGFQSPIDFIKIDAEGFEPFILRGGTSLIALNKPAMLIEVNRLALKAQGSSAEELYSLLAEMNYEFKPVEPHLKFEDEQIDIICTHRYR